MNANGNTMANVDLKNTGGMMGGYPGAGPINIDANGNTGGVINLANHGPSGHGPVNIAANENHMANIDLVNGIPMGPAPMGPAVNQPPMHPQPHYPNYYP